MPTQKSDLVSALISAVSILVSKGGGAGAAFVALLILTNSLDPAGAGFVILVQSVAILAALLATLNAEDSAMRVLPGGEEKAPGTTAAWFTMWRANVLLCLPFAMAAGAAWLAFQTQSSLPALIMAGLTIPAAAFFRSTAYIGKAIGNVRRSSFIAMTLRPLIFTAALGCLALSGMANVVTATAALFLSFALPTLLQIPGIKPGLPPARPPDPKADLRSWRRTGLVLMAAYLLAEGYQSTVLLVSSISLPPDDIARLGVCLRIALLLLMGIIAVEISIAPAMSRALKLDRSEETENLGQKICLFGLLIVTAGAAVVGGISDFILSLFGEAYAGDTDILRSLLLIPLTASFFGPNLSLLSIAGENRAILKVSVVNVILHGVVIYAAIPYGLFWVATGLVGTQLIWQLSLFLTVRNKLGMSVWLPAAILQVKR